MWSGCGPRACAARGCVQTRAMLSTPTDSNRKSFMTDISFWVDLRSRRSGKQVPCPPRACMLSGYGCWSYVSEAPREDTLLLPDGNVGRNGDFRDVLTP